jgi:acylphosphatase
MLELQIICHGNVQGVGFRAAVKRMAEESKLTGFVRNLRNGSVEVVIQGEKEGVDDLFQQINDQFEIDEFTEKYKKISKPYSKFTILF